MTDTGTYHHSAAGHHKHGHAHHAAAVASLETATAAAASDLDGMKVTFKLCPPAPLSWLTLLSSGGPAEACECSYDRICPGYDIGPGAVPWREYAHHTLPAR